MPAPLKSFFSFLFRTLAQEGSLARTREALALALSASERNREKEGARGGTRVWGWSRRSLSKSESGVKKS